MQKKKPNTMTGYQPSDCAHCKYLLTSITTFRRGRGLEKVIACTLDEHRLDGNLEQVDAACPLSKEADADE